MNKRMRKALLVAACFALTICLSIGGTLAWLKGTTQTVTNTFTQGDVEIVLNEGEVYELADINASKTDDLDEADLGKHKDNGETRTTTNTYQIVPGSVYDKDPIVSVVPTSEDCYLFVKFYEGSAATYLTYTSNLTADNGWTKLEGAANVEAGATLWYRVVEKEQETKSWNLLDGDTITVKNDIADDTMSNAAASQLVWTAYAIQKANIADAATAWGYLNTPANP